MTLSNTIRFIEKVALLQPAIKSVVPNDVYRLNAMPDAEYAVFGWTQGQHTISIEDSYATYAFTFFYIDRLTEDQGNQVEIQSVGVQVLDNIIRMLDSYGAQPSTTCNYTTFNQRFLDECAGVFVSVTLQVPLNGICEEMYFDFNDDFNDDFNSTGLDFDAEGFEYHGGGGGGGGNFTCCQHFEVVTQEEYDAMAWHDPDIFYLIPEL